MQEKLQNTDSGHHQNTDFEKTNTEHKFFVWNTERVL